MDTIKNELKYVWVAMGIMAVIGLVGWLILGKITDYTGIIAWSGACLLYGFIQSLIILQKK